MAGTDRYTDPNITGNTVTKLLRNLNSAGGEGVRKVYFTVAKTALDTDGSILRVIKGLDPDTVITKIALACDAIAGLTSVGVGVYASKIGGAALAPSGYAAAISMAAGAATFLDGIAFNGMTAITHNNFYQRVFEIAGHTVVNKLGSYDLALTFTTGGANTGNISGFVEYANQ